MAISGCVPDAPHDNPLDPKNSTANLSLEGRVYTYYPPYKPVGGAALYLLPANQMAVTDENGYYIFPNLKTNTYTLICQKQGYAGDTMQVDLYSGTNYDFHLDQLPYFEQISLKTHHLSRWFPVEDAYYLEIQTRVNDADGVSDITKVEFRIPELSFVDTLREGNKAGHFGHLISADDLPVNSLSQLIGREFVFRVQDDPGFVSESSSHYLTRIIEEVPVLVSPVGLETVVGDSVQFEWQKVILPYEFTFKIELYQINLGISTIIDEIENISSDLTAYRYQPTLPASDYLWRVLIVDRYGNTSGSREGVFRVP